MTKPRNALFAASSIVMAVALTGCALGGGSTKRFGGMVENSNIGVAMRAHLALQQGDVAGAIALAEKAVEKSPTDAAFRTLLGNAYLAGGRFRSAEAAFADALAMYPDQTGVPLKLVLTQVAQGKADAAAQTLDTYAQVISPADAGLAMALAGRPGAAIEMLDVAARGAGADARVRQNLALAHAIAGDWARARQVAAQDLAGDQLEVRMSEWAAFARPGTAPASQVASLIGVKAPSSVDAGMPVRLARKVETKNDDILFAEAAPVPQAPVPAASEPVAVAAARVEEAAPVAYAEAEAPAPVAVAQADLPAPVAAPAPDVVAMVDSLRAERIKPNGSLPKVAELRRAAAKRFGASKAVVQLGAYSTPSGLKAGWETLSRRHGGLSAYVPASARFNDARGSVYRLSLKGFASDGEARALCMKLKASGATCFVRNAAGDAPVRFASK
ncbi:tetratricopeptide repeat protein [Sphingomonas kaistensis]|uniref:Tetratricopeptide repeat protein n=1 Tax=Sphingomonas kaistensis TaxID=298708 RepID=A0ABZ2G557_9SPHN